MSDLSRVLLFRKDNPKLGKLNDYHKKLLQEGDYDFWEYFELNTKLLEFYREISSSIDIYLFTSKYIQEYPPIRRKLRPVFKKIFSAARLGVHKSTPEAYQKISNLIDLPPQKILFIDDSQSNIGAAKRAGLNTIYFTDTETAIKELREILTSNTLRH